MYDDSGKADFEAQLFLQLPHHDLSLEKGDDGEYTDQDVLYAWQGWLAARAVYLPDRNIIRNRLSSVLLSLKEIHPMLGDGDNSDAVGYQIVMIEKTLNLS